MILIAENSLDLRKFYISAYGQFPFEFALDGHDLVQQARLRPYNLLWVDLVMPFMSGSEAVKVIRAEPGPNQSTSIMAVTGLPVDAIDPDELRGFDLAYTKPVPHDTIFKLFTWATTPKPVSAV